MILCCKFETGTITSGKQFTVFLRSSAINDRAYRMQDITTRQIICGSDLRLPCRFLMPLCFHHLCTFIAKLRTCKGVDAVVDTFMIWRITSSHSTVRRIDDRITAERSNITLPEIDSLLDRSEISKLCDAFFLRLFFQIFVLNLQKFSAEYLRCTYIKKSSKEILLPLWIFWDRIITVFFLLV